MPYEPREDTFLLKKHLAMYCRGKVLDMGTGSGELAEEAAKYGDEVIAVDIEGEAVKAARKRLKQYSNVKVKKSDLFSALKKEVFDTIIFNPPYLPNDPRVKDIALDGGKHGYEIIGRFLNEAASHLTEQGKLLLLFSSLSKKDIIDQILRRNLFTFVEIDQQKFDFEQLYVYLIAKTKDLIALEKLNIKDICYFAKGRRGYIYTGIYQNKKVAIKVKNPLSDAQATIQHEGDMLAKLQQHEFVPKVLFSNADALLLEFIEGDFIIDYIVKAKKQEIMDILNRIFDIMYLLDTLKLKKEEMHHPIKHIIITKDKAIKLLDYERVHYTEYPGNVTQFAQFVMSLENELKRKRIKLDRDKMRVLAKAYKKSFAKEDFEKLKGALQ